MLRLEVKEHKLELKNFDEEQYGSDYKAHILEQWKIAVTMSNAISERRTNMNNIFLTLNSMLVALITFQFEKKSMGYALIGIVVCLIWISNLENYKKLNTAKFKIINKLEKELPANVFDYEWDLVGRGDDGKKYKRMSNLERIIPLIFVLVYVVAIVYPLLFR